MVCAIIAVGFFNCFAFSIGFSALVIAEPTITNSILCLFNSGIQSKVMPPATAILLTCGNFSLNFSTVLPGFNNFSLSITVWYW